MEHDIVAFLVILGAAWLVWWIVHKMGIPAMLMNIAEIVIVVVAALAIFRLILPHL